MISTRDDGM